MSTANMQDLRVLALRKIAGSRGRRITQWQAQRLLKEEKTIGDALERALNIPESRIRKILTHRHTPPARKHRRRVGNRRGQSIMVFVLALGVLVLFWYLYR